MTQIASIQSIISRQKAKLQTSPMLLNYNYWRSIDGKINQIFFVDPEKGYILVIDLKRDPTNSYFLMEPSRRYLESDDKFK